MLEDLGVPEDLGLQKSLERTVGIVCVEQEPLGADEWLLVRGRAKGNSDQNAHVYDSAGTLSRSFHAGDGIEDIQTTEDGRTWVSYFDEGVFGGTTLGQAGLACLDRSGQVNFKFSDLAARGTDIADCYALNVCSDQVVWRCYYTDFPLVQLANGKIAGIWPELSVKGSILWAEALLEPILIVSVVPPIDCDKPLRIIRRRKEFRSAIPGSEVSFVLHNVGCRV